jgi:hypothetical protein
MIDYKTLISVVNKYNDEADRIFNKLHRADLEAKTGIIEYGKHAYMERIEWDYSDENTIVIRYYDHGYDLYCSCTMSIPADIFFNEDKIDAWIESLISAELERQEKDKEDRRKIQEEKERKEYERLMEKYGSLKSVN